METEHIEKEIERRSTLGYELAKKYPELRGLSFPDFLEKCPLDLDFITASEMHEALEALN